MFNFLKNIKILAVLVIALVGLFIIGNLYSLFRGQNYVSNGTNIGALLFLLVVGLGIGAFCMYLLNRVKQSAGLTVTETSHTVVESMKKVFKVVCAEGQLTELYNYEQTKKILSFIPSTKKALVIVRAKVLIGFDFEKCKWETDEENKIVKLVYFPEPELLAIEPDFKYYDMDENIFDRFSREDLNKIQINGKKQVELAALSGDLPKMAADQMKVILSEVIHSNKWQLQNTEIIKAKLPESTTAVG
jgi:Protein of unknown function (DUF4230)